MSLPAQSVDQPTAPTSPGGGLLERLSQALTGALRPELAFELVPRLLVPELADVCAIYRAGPVGESFIAALAAASPELELRLTKLREQPHTAQNSLAARVVATGQSVFLPEIDPDLPGLAPRIFRGALELGEVGSALCVPMHARGTVVGAITAVLTRSSQRRYRPEDVELIEEVARRVGVAVDTGRLLQGMRQLTERLQRLHTLTAELANAVTRKEVGRVVLEHASASIGANTAGLFLRSADGTGAELAADVGYWPELRARCARLPLEEALPVTDVLRQGGELWLASREDYLRRYPHLRGLERPEVTDVASACLALPGDGAAAGCLVFSFEQGQPFTQEDREFLRTVARSTTQALDRARLYEQAHRARDEAERAEAEQRYLSEASATLGASLEPAETLAALAKVTLGMLGELVVVDGAELDPSRPVAVAALEPRREELLRTLRRHQPLGAHDTIVRALKTGEPAIYHYDLAALRTYARGEEHLRLLTELGIASSLIVPLRARGATLGVLTLSSGARRYGERDLKLATALAARAALALDNARLFQAEQTARAQAQAATERLARLQGVISALGEAPAPDDVARVVMTEGLAFVGGDQGALWVTSDDGSELELRGQVALSDRARERYGRLSVDSPVAIAAAIREGRARFFEDRAAMDAAFPSTAELRQGIAFGAAAVVPLISARGASGALVYSFARPRPFSPEARRELEQLSHLYAEALDRARLYARAEGSRVEAERHSRTLQAVFQASPLAVMLLDPEGRVQMWSPAATRTFGWTEQEVLGQPLPTVPASQWPQFLENLRAVASGRAVPQVEGRRLRKDGSEFEATIWTARTDDAEGRPLLLGIVADATERHRGEQALQLLARAGELLSSSLELEPVLQRLAELAVPGLADWAIVDLVTGRGTLRRLVAHADPRHAALADRLRREIPVGSPDQPGIAQVVRSGQTVCVNELPRGFPDAVARDPEHGQAVAELAPTAYVSVPLRFGERIEGVLSWIRCGRARPFTAEEVGVAEELARRAALALDRVRLFDEAQHARLRAEEASRTKDEFLATMSHELRTPLTAILGYANLLRKGAIPPDRQERALEVIERNAKAQAQLVSDLLDLSRIATGKLRLDVRTLEPSRVVEAAMESVRLAAEAKGIALDLELGSRPPLVAGDADRLQQVIWNLLTNAIKFTPRGGKVTVTLSGEGEELVLSVQDDGEGIPLEFLPLLFQRFRQADASAKRQHGGLGLGLSLVRHLVELHGGTVAARSEGVGRGARFEIRLPALRSVDLRASPGRVRVPVRLDGTLILVVEDDPDAREMLVNALELHGARVTTAASAAEGMEALRGERPTAIVSDLGMPVEDGCSFLRRVRELPLEEGGGVPALALSAYARAEDRERALQAGFQRHLAKPVDPAELVAQVGELILRS